MKPAQKIRAFFNNRTNLILFLALLLIIVVGFLGFKAIGGNKSKQVPLQEVDLSFDPEGPYALLYPRRDGNALVLNIKRVSAYDAISYELAYQSDGIDRGVQGNIDTKNKKNEYTQEILFGTCSTVDTYNIKHCVFDPNVENGTLTLKIQQGRILYKMITQWHLQKPDVALGALTSGDGHFTDKLTDDRQGLALIGFTIINDLSGAPKLPEGKEVLGKVYSLNASVAKEVKSGQVSIELADKPPAEAKIARYDSSQNKWTLLDTKIASGSALVADTDRGGIFTVLTAKP